MKIIGIKTNNLKNVDIEIDLGTIIGIFGPSGGGKTSLAYSTIYKLCYNTFNSIQNGFELSEDYIVDEYENLIPTVGIRQLNLNTNPRSTIYSYLNFATFISSSKHIDIPYSYLKLNNPLNECKVCKGLGIIYSIDISLAIDENLTIKEIPFIAWKKQYNTGSNLYENLLLEFCKKYDIDVNKKFSELPQSKKELLLYSKSETEFQIKYKSNKRYRNKKVKFIGYLIWLEIYLHSSKKSEYNFARKFSSEQPCKQCKGSRLDIEKYKNLFIDKISFIDFLSQPIKQVIKYIDKNKYKKIYEKLNNMLFLGIGYLNLSRAIPTLSGGELQKLNLTNLINSKISNILIVIDEITSGLNAADYDNIVSYLKQIQKSNNSLMLIEHNKYFLSKCDTLIKVGPGSGKKGGYLIEPKLENIKFQFKEKKQKLNNFIQLNNININNVKNQTIKFPEKSITSIIGKSGSGKSSVALFIEKKIDNVIYISQKNLKGNIKSTLASVLEINKHIAQAFSKKYNKDYHFFMPNSGSKIICQNCNGQGVIKYERSFEEDIIITCPECNGSLFNKESLKYTIDNNISLYDIYNFTIDELNNLKSINKFDKFIELSNYLSLGHLSLNRKTNTLSGGELKRVKIIKTLLNKSLKNKILIIDEPSAGLDENSALRVLNIIKKYKQDSKSIILIEHNPYIFFETDFIIELGPDAGDEGGKVIFCNNANEYYKKYYEQYKKYMDF